MTQPTFDIEQRITEIRLAKIQMAAFIFVHLSPKGTTIAGRIGETTHTLYAFTHSDDWAEFLNFWCHPNIEAQPVSYQKWRDNQRRHHREQGTEFPDWAHYETLWREKTREELLHRLAIDASDDIVDMTDLENIPEPVVKTEVGSLSRAEREWTLMFTGEALTLDLRGDHTGIEVKSNG